MKKIFYSCLFISTLCTANASFAQADLWRQFKGEYAPSSMEMIVRPASYRILTLDNAAMKQYLADVSSDMNTAKEIEVPTPEGSFRTFKIWKNTAMHPDLAAKYPEILTFDGYAVDNPNVTAKFGFNPFGFSAQVHDGGNTYYVDPYSNAQDGYYMAFYKRDLPFETVHCASEEKLRAFGINDVDHNDQNVFQFENNNSNPNFVYSHSNQNRKFRAAITNTGEWATAIVGLNPAKHLVVAKIVEIVNRINGYYEREIAVTLELIANNDVLVFNNKDTDPYNNNNSMEPLLNESHQSIVNRVGGNNFDIGHIFCTAGGGLAQLASVCNSNGKGRAASTINSTTNLKTVMHEMGHQMNASHTFSANTGGCNNNGMPEGAYESGSGITIMSYEGACVENNVSRDPGTDDYFHVHTLYQITNHINGVNCGTLSTNIPVLSLENITDKYNIPKNTPFELVGNTATVQGSQIPQTFFYNWEQYDIGFDRTEADAGNATDGPSLKSHYPNASTSQAYPPIPEIIANNYSLKGYRLPNTARKLNFKYTARGILGNKGAFNTIDSTLQLNVVASAGPFRVTSHRSGTSNWNPGETVEIRWDVANTNAAPINCQGVSIYMHFPDGSQPDIQLVAYAPNTGSFFYPVQNFYAKDGYLKIKGAGNVFFDMSKGKINVKGVNIDKVTFNENISIFPNPTSDNITIKNSNLHTKLTVTVLSITGKVVYQGEMKDELKIDVSNYAKGNYIVQLKDEITQNSSSHKVSVL